MKEYLVFKKFITPIALQVLFWGGMGGVFYGTWWLYTHGNWAWIMSLVFGSLVTRLIFENLIIRYQSHLLLKEIRDNLVKGKP
ncbi:MAG: hypothetical protein ACRBF0_18420 [Calditrichia bacterium]